MLVLGIESSCDETAAAVVEDACRVRSSAVASQVDIHARFGGVVPELAGRAHVEAILPAITRALDEAGVTLDDLEAIAVGHRPGLVGALLVGVAAAKSLAWTLGVPLIGVDHVQAHLYAGLLGRSEPRWPALGLVVSGGHTTLYRCEAPHRLSRLGSTIDDAVGEAYDKAASTLGLAYPGGPEIDRLAELPGADDRAVDLPISRLAPGSLDLSFSGLKTSLLYAARGVPGGRDRAAPPELTPERVRDLAASFQRAAVKAIMLKLERAFEHVGGTEACPTLLTGGGVTANTRLRRDLAEFAEQRGLDLRLPELRFCVDNAAMIAGLGARRLAEGERSGLDLEAVPVAAC
ncbi:MAG: tRNA (adenosine(37)-N6)-threonylcarbamoyltransferase complex transferase subunit TsaD [Planctomycetota bacterium]